MEGAQVGSVAEASSAAQRPQPVLDRGPLRRPDQLGGDQHREQVSASSTAVTCSARVVANSVAVRRASGSRRSIAAFAVNPWRARPSSLSLIHISEPTRLGMISYAVFCLTK